jgi:divalent metal cation (Fe/Co/Zn/Cd) transporter
MNRNITLIIAAILLLILGVYMIYLGTAKNIIPPTVTGVGFIAIAIAFLSLRTR